jgi:hypothetical protein
MDNGRQQIAASYNNKAQMENLNDGIRLFIGGFEVEIQHEMHENKIGILSPSNSKCF